MDHHRLDRGEARRIAVRAQLLDAHRPIDLLTVVKQLTFLQLDPTAAVAPSADLVAWTRLGGAYQPAHLQQALERNRSLFEHRAMVRPMTDLRLYLAEMAAWTGDERRHNWLRANESFRRDMCSTCCATPDRCCRATCLTAAPCRGRRPAGRTTATSLRCWSPLLFAARSPWPAALDGSDCGIWPSVSTRPIRDRPPAAEALRLRNEKRLHALGIARESNGRGGR